MISVQKPLYHFATYLGVLQLHLIEMGAGEICAGKIRPFKIAALQMGPAEIGAL